MAFTTGFYNEECSIYYECSIEDNEEKFENPKVGFLVPEKYKFKSSYLGLIYVYSGELTIYHCEQFIKIPEKTLIATSPEFPLNFVSSIKNTELVTVSFHSSLLNRFHKASNLFKVFYTEDINKRIYTPKMHEENIVAPLFNSLKSMILAHYNEPYIYSRLVTIVTELNLIYDRYFGSETKEIPNLSAKLIDYIERNYAEKLTIESLSEKFFTSPSTIHRICKKAFGKTFKEKLSELRLREARALIQKKNFLPSRAAKICGYDDYSSFFRAYKKAYGISPANEISNKKG